MSMESINALAIDSPFLLPQPNYVAKPKEEKKKPESPRVSKTEEKSETKSSDASSPVETKSVIHFDLSMLRSSVEGNESMLRKEQIFSRGGMEANMIRILGKK